MAGDNHLDGNVMGGLLHELFDREMTSQLGCCGECGAIKALGEVHVYRDAPGDVMRCPVCEKVLMVIVPLASGYRVSIESLRWIEIDSRRDTA